MTNLRQGRWLQAVCDACSAKSSFAAAALLGVLLAPGAALASAPHAHARRPLPTLLHSTSVTAGSSRSGAKRKKSSLKERTGAKADTHQAGAHGAAKAKSKKRGHAVEPVDEAVPMYRAGREVRGVRGSKTRHESAVVAAGRHGRYRNDPAPLVSAYRHVHGTGSVPAGSRMVASDPRSRPEIAEHWHALAGQRLLEPRTATRVMAAADLPPAPIVRRQPAAPATVSTPTNRPDAFAEGVSHPDADVRMATPRSQVADEAADEASDVPATLRAHVLAAPHAPSAVLPQAGVVQGFGGEVAVPSAGAGTAQGVERPGGTRRRNHPSTWTPGPTAVTSEPLEEREAITFAAVSPAVLPQIYDRNGRLAMPAPLKGSHEVLVHQNWMADSDGLQRIQNDADLERMRASHQLITLPASESLHVNEDLPANRRVARPWTAMFAYDIGRAFYARFHEPIYVTSAARTVSYQLRLQTVNGNAAGTSGDAASPHLTGQAIDMAKRGMSHAELAWMREYLLPLMQSGKVDVEEEFHQACFHVSVYRSYAAGRRPIVHEVAQVRAAVPAQETATPETAVGAVLPDDR